MSEYIIKTIHIKECRRCRSVWAAEKINIEINNVINFITTKIMYCPHCASDFAKETDRPFYERSGKRIK